MSNVDEHFSNPEITTIILPILPATSNFFCCCRRLHITSAAKIVSVISSLAYFVLVFAVTLGGNAAAVLNSILIALSVSACTIYGAFRWCKLCLIPFIMLQIILMFYAVISLLAAVYATFQRSSYLHKITGEMLTAGQLKISPKIVLLLTIYLLLVLILLIAYSIRIIWYDYQFIAAIDRFVSRTQKQTPEV
ncbi:Uncharacterized protein Tcan_10783 [Toxocara canis]|uniref:Uncharacterized protein n=1 Tax=Toxocara canis TaxID=6265 RepID=A0A0B2UYP3_TOXCA|nr:Uncharacterized protein Tcan_10783 [Toxocara canis]